MSFEIANERSLQIRRARGNVKRQLRAGVMTVADVLVDPPEEMLGVRLFEVLQWDPRFGRDGARSLVRKLNMRAAHEGINLMSELGSSTERQRFWLAAEVQKVRRVGRTPRLTPVHTA